MRKVDVIKKINSSNFLITFSYFIDFTDTALNHLCSSIYIHITYPVLLWSYLLAISIRCYNPSPWLFLFIYCTQRFKAVFNPVPGSSWFSWQPSVCLQSIFIFSFSWSWLIKITVSYGLSKHYREGKQDPGAAQSNPQPCVGWCLTRMPDLLGMTAKGHGHWQPLAPGAWLKGHRLLQNGGLHITITSQTSREKSACLQVTHEMVPVSEQATSQREREKLSPPVF